LIVRGEEIVIDAGSFKISIPCSSDPKFLIGSGKLRISDQKKLRNVLEGLGIFDQVKFSPSLKTILIKNLGKRIFIFESGEMKMSGFEDKRETEIIAKLVVSLVFFTNADEEDEYFNQIINEFVPKIRQVKHGR
jgi:hypothetical protein